MKKINQWAARANRRIKERQLSRIQNKNQQESIQDRLGSFITLISVILFVLIIWSILTESAFLWPTFKNNTGSSLWAGFLTIVVVIVIEAAKLGAGPLWLQFKTHGWFGDGAYYWIFYVFITLVVLIGFGGSATFSIKGGPTIASNLKNQSSTLSLIDLDSIHAKYNDLKSQELIKQAQGAQMTWRGKVVSDGRQIINEAQATINKYEELRMTEIESAMQENERRRQAHEASISNFGGWVQGLGGIGELLTLLLITLRLLYYRAVADEQVDEDDPEVNYEASQSPDPGPAPGGSTTPTPQPQAQQRSIQDILRDGMLNLPRGEAETVQTLSEQQKTHPAGTDIRKIHIRDDRVIEHKGEDGRTRLYRIQDVDGFISKYQRRVDDLVDRIKQGKATARTQAALENNQTKLNYWTQRRQEFN